MSVCVRRIVRALVSVQIKSAKQDLAQLERLGLSEGTAHLAALLPEQRWKPGSQWLLVGEKCALLRAVVLKCQLPPEPPGRLVKIHISNSGGLGGQGRSFAFLTNSQGMPLLLVQGSPFEEFQSHPSVFLQQPTHGIARHPRRPRGGKRTCSISLNFVHVSFYTYTYT